jgi:2-phosphosulfolactate phosphatase
MSQIDKIAGGKKEESMGVKIVRKSCFKGVKQAEGLVVIIDVFRAFSCQPLFFHFGAHRVLLEADTERALFLKSKIPGAIMVGEIDEIPIEGAELGNSPSHIIRRGKPYFNGRTVIHRTTAGVAGVKLALERSEEVVLGSFVMASAICNYIQLKNPSLVTLVAMGERGKEEAPEDEACADYLEHLISGRPFDQVDSLSRIVFQPTAQKFIRKEKSYLPSEDPIFCLQKDLFDFVLTAHRSGSEIEVLKAVP